MKKLLRILSLMTALLLTMSCGLAETAEPAVALVNGEPLLYSDYLAIESAYIAQYEAAGVSMADPTAYGYVQDLALTYAVEQMLVVQDMKAQGCYDFDEEIETWCVTEGKAAYEQALTEVGEMMRDTLDLPAEEDMREYALSYAEALNVTVDTYIEEFRTQYAMALYQEWLIHDNPVTDEQVQAAYEARVADSQTRFAGDVAAFEKALYSGEETWYMPEGYRAIQWMMLATDVQGETDADKLATQQGKVDAIRARLAAGETFEALNAEFSADSAVPVTTEQIHRDSTVFSEAVQAGAYSEAMAAPGDCTAVVSDGYVLMLYYLADVPAGPVEMTEELHDALAYTLYAERTQQARAKRIDELAEKAEVVIY